MTHGSLTGMYELSQFPGSITDPTLSFDFRLASKLWIVHESLRHIGVWRHGLEEGAGYGHRLQWGHLHLWCGEPGFLMCIRRYVTHSLAISQRCYFLTPRPQCTLHAPSHWNYLVIVSPLLTGNLAFASATIRNFAARPEAWRPLVCQAGL
jgi:hypothetical protein